MARYWASHSPPRHRIRTPAERIASHCSQRRIAFAWALIVTLSRVYSGLHFLSDITGGAGLGVALVCVSQLRAIRYFCLVFARWAIERSDVFYATAFIASFLVASTFDDVRSIGTGLAKLLHYM